MINFRVENPTTPALSWWDRRRVWLSGWLVSAAAAAGFALVSTLPGHRAWGLCAAAGYLLAAGAAALMPRPGARTAAVALALVGAAVGPLLGFAALGVGQSEVTVIERSGQLLVDTGSPYLADPAGVRDYNPYLPGMALLGLPRTLLGADGWPATVLGDARLWCAAGFVGCLAAGRGLLRPTDDAGRAGPPYGLLVAALIASPVVALSWSVSGVDLPLTGLCCLALAAAARGRATTAGVALALACALKWVIWPALPVVCALLYRRFGARAARRCAGVAAAGAGLLILPIALSAPGPMWRQVIAFPTGNGAVATPASSPLPGRLLTELGAVGRAADLALLLCVALIVLASLALLPPADAPAAGDRLALALSAAFLLAPAARFGYFLLPAVLVAWTRLAGGRARQSTFSGSVPLQARFETAGRR